MNCWLEKLDSRKKVLKMKYQHVKMGANVTIKKGVHIGKNVIIDDNVFIDFDCIIRDNVHIEQNSFIGAKSIIGEYLADFYLSRTDTIHQLVIGKNALIRTENVIYGNTIIGDYFQTGHKVTIRENTHIGSHVRIGTYSDVQHHVTIGDYVNIHSNCFICELTTIKNYVWIFPHVVFTNDPIPPSKQLLGITVESFAVLSAGSVLLAGIHIHDGSVIGAGAVVTKDVPAGTLVVGVPAKYVCKTTEIKNKFTGEANYPWQYFFDREMPWEGIGYDDWMNQTGKK